MAKSIAGNQKALEAVPFNSGTWRVAGVPGLYVRARAQSRSFFIQRRVRGLLVKESLGQVSMKVAREQAMKTWSALKPKPAAKDVVTLAMAVDRYLEEKPLSETTIKLTRYNFKRYFKDWADRSLRDIGNDRAGFRAFQRAIKTKHGKATSNQTRSLMSGVYHWQRKIDPTLPENPATATEPDRIPARNWAYRPDELRVWRTAVDKLKLSKKVWWMTGLYTGARKGSINALRWQDVDLARGVIRFSVAKGGRVYTVPMSDALTELLVTYKDSRAVIPGDSWLFPSRKGNSHLKQIGRYDSPGQAHRLRHSFRTTLTELGAPDDSKRILMGHSLGGVSLGYITAGVVTDSLRPVVNAVAAHYERIFNG